MLCRGEPVCAAFYFLDCGNRERLKSAKSDCRGRGFVNGNQPRKVAQLAMLPPHSERPRRCCNLVRRLKPCLLCTPLKCKVAGMWCFHVYYPIASGFFCSSSAGCRTCLISILSYPPPPLVLNSSCTARIVAQLTGFGVLRSGKFGGTDQLVGRWMVIIVQTPSLAPVGVKLLNHKFILVLWPGVIVKVNEHFYCTLMERVFLEYKSRGELS